MKSPILLAVIVLCSFTFLRNQDWTMPKQHFLANPKTETQAELIVFCETENQYFIKETLPKIKKYCTEKKITLVERKNTEGVPSELSSLPALVFQNGKSRSIYAARYAEFSTIENFIRTSRAFPQQLALNCKKDVLAYQNGRMKIATTLKITPLGGTIPSNFDATEFEKNTQITIDEAMQNFAFQTETCLQKTDRMFYLDIHPYLDKTGKLFLSYELYSQFSCTVPVFSKLKIPLEGTLDNSKMLLTQIGSIIEKEIFAQLKNSTIGDAYSAISSETPTKTWQELGLQLSENQDVSQAKSVFENKKLTSKWSFAGAIDAETPAMAFHFQEPLDRYAGEVRQIKGTLQLNDNQKLMQGAFDVNTASLTMGIDDFDHKIHEKYIKVGRFPVATFSFKDQAIALAFGKTTDANIVGDFTLMGKTIPMTMQAQLTPSVGSKGEMLLAVQTSFSLNIANVFGIKGPDGPDPANKTMQFFMNFFCNAI